MPLTTLTKVSSKQLDTTALKLASLSDVNLSVAPAIGHTIIWNGVKFVAGASFSPTDFNNAFAAKTTSNLSEGVNQYFTTARARGAISATGSLNYDPSTGVFSFTQGNTDTITEGSNNLYFTNARSRGAVSAVGSISYNSSTGVFSFTQGSTDTITEGTTNKYYTDTRARAAISAGTNITYSSTTGVVSLSSGNVTGALGFTPYNSTNPNGYTTNTGTVTSVGGTGTVSGLTLTGSVTTTGSLTLGGTLNLSSPPAIGGTAPNAGTFTTLTVSGDIISSGAVKRTMAGDGTVLEIKSSYTNNPVIVSLGQLSSDGFLSIKDASGNETLISGYNGGTSKFASKIRALNTIQRVTSSLSGTETNIITLDDGTNSLGRIASYNNGGYNQDLRIYTTNAAGANERLTAVFYGDTRSLQTFGQRYATWTESVQTIDGGVQTVRILEDCYGRWTLVGRFAADASNSISSVISTVRGLTTATDQNTTAFSADFGSSYPSEVRIVGATDWTRWKDTRTIDWVYKVPSGRTWGTFFNGGSSTMDQAYTNPAGGTRYGFNVVGAYDGFGRWSNPNMTSMGMSDTATTNPSSAYSSPTANAINWYTSGQDSKLSVTHVGAYGGQDYNATASFGYDDGGNNFFDVFPSQYNNNTGTKMFTSAVWVLIKLS